MNFEEQLINFYKEIGVEEHFVATKPRKHAKAAITSANAPHEADHISNIDDLIDYIKNFNGCNLKELANSTVIYDGQKTAEILLVGEAPGAQEDIEGRPFCGDSGKLLDLMLASIKLTREKNVFITNNIFWRPPANRKPTNEELEICRPLLDKIIALINPKVIIAVGSVAAQNLTGHKNMSMNDFRLNPINYQNRYMSHSVPVYTLFHPAYLLRQPSQKRTAWLDLIKIEKFLKESNINI